MKIQSVNIPYASRASQTKKSNGTNSFKNHTCIVIPTEQQNDTFGVWAVKNIATASILSLVCDSCTNAISKFKPEVTPVPIKEMGVNICKVAGVFLLVGGIFQFVNDFIDSKL